ncbi:MAG TPA: hypothetical protein VJZ27_01005 [Aggregatilineales bacterium]|nr:hypothetical protein [Aggregatilineales bacterium]
MSFLFSLFGLFGVGHLFAGAPSKGIAYFIAGIIWDFLAGVLIIGSGSLLVFCLLPLHLVFAHFCAANAVKIARGDIIVN